MNQPLHPTGQELLEAVFSDDPAPDIHAVVVVSHPGDECLGASWLLSRLYDRTSVFRLTTCAQGATPDAITMTGLPAERCQNLGLESGSLAKDLETLTWLVSASVKTLSPRLLITHAWEGVNLDHDAVAFAVQMTALMLPRFGIPMPVVLEFQCHHDGPEAVHHDAAAPTWEQGVRVDFGPDSRRLKEQILRSQLGSMRTSHYSALRSEIYRPQAGNDVAQRPEHSARRYHDAPWCTVRDFRSNAITVARSFAQTGLIAAGTV
jgi:hypothetical protein